MADQQSAALARPYSLLDDPVVYPVILFGVILTTAFPVFLGQQLCLPLLNGLVIFPLFVMALRLGRPLRAIGLVLFWAACQSAATVAASLVFSNQASVAIWRGLEIRTEMMTWIASGEGVMSAPGRFLPQYFQQLGLFSLVTLLSGGLGGLVLLASALNMFNLYVASLLQQAGQPLLGLVLAWPLWSVVRLIGFVVCGTVLAEPVAVLDLRPSWWTQWWVRRRRLLFVGIGLLVLALLLQVVLAPAWPSLLRRATGL